MRLAVLSIVLFALSSCELDDAGDLYGEAGSAGTTASAGSAGAVSSAGSSSNAGSSGAGGAGGDSWPETDAAPFDASAGSAAGAGSAPDAAAVDAGCLPHTFCIDADHDGYGVPGSRTIACEPPGADWIPETSATTCTDCFDQSDVVHPGSTTCVIEGYVSGSAPASFDADCDGVETECGAKAAAQCGGTLGVCSGDGYLPEGKGQNPYCGSKSFQKCSGLDCKASTQSLPNEPLGCR